MKKRLLGNTGIELSEVGYGCAALWGKNVLGKQGVTEEQAYKLFEHAFSHGINFFDTGINYGYAEERLGRCLSRIIGGVQRDVKILLSRQSLVKLLMRMGLTAL